MTSVVDNTLSTPLLSRPLGLGADVVVHSVTKYLAGHSDVVLGATVVADDERGREIGARLKRHRTLHGSIAGPMEVFLALRGLRTLSVRFERACANAAELARRLADHPGVARVRFPGNGAMLAIDVAGDAAAADRVCDATTLWLHSTSLGGVESQLERRRRHPSEPTSVPANLLRLSVGIEHVEDLWPTSTGRCAGGSRSTRPCSDAGRSGGGVGRAAGLGVVLLGLEVARHELRPDVGGRLAVPDDGDDLLDDRHVDAVVAGQLEDRLARLDPLGGLPGRGDDLVDGQPLAEPHPEGVVARERGHARRDEVTDPGEAEEGLRLCPERQPEPGRLGETTGDDRRLGVVAEPHPLGHPDREARRRSSSRRTTSAPTTSVEV